MRPLILGCAGLRLTAEEAGFFARAGPLGFILFARNCDNPDQVAGLAADLRQAVGRPAAPLLIDQEGGRVVRLGPPHWRQPPAAAVFGRLAATDRQGARRAAWINGRLIAADLSPLGITVDCAPLIDLSLPGAHDIIGDRAFGGDPGLVAELGRALADGLIAGGLLPVIKHIPGHGRAPADSHCDLPRVEAGRATLSETDFAPFRALADLPLAMTAHVVYTQIDAGRPATISARVIGDVIRRQIGFAGLLMSDDIGMKALSGTMAARTRECLDAGCDIVLHCSGDMAEMTAIADAAAPLPAPGAERLTAAFMPPLAGGLDKAALESELAALLKQLE